MQIFFTTVGVPSMCACTHTHRVRNILAPKHTFRHTLRWRCRPGHTHRHTHTPCIQLKTHSFCHSYTPTHAHMPEHFVHSAIDVSPHPAPSLRAHRYLLIHIHGQSHTHARTYTHSFTFLKPCIHMLTHPYTISQMHTQWTPTDTPSHASWGAHPF